VKTAINETRTSFLPGQAAKYLCQYKQQLNMRRGKFNHFPSKTVVYHFNHIINALRLSQKNKLNFYNTIDLPSC